MQQMTSRMKSFPPDPSKAWVSGIEKASGETQNQGKLAEFLMFFVSRMSILFDGDNFKSDVSDKLLHRLASVDSEQVQKWKVEYDKVLGQNMNKVPIAFILLPVDRFYESDRYMTDRAGIYRERLKQLSKEDVKRWIDEIDQYGGSELDGAMNIILIDEFFNGERFDKETYNALLNK
jgi:hypothetical protein